ncbi:DUF7793 family protein [Aurantibacillus circumpalustris]|uniref:DUF7793 family protein n=1 Tax=Aurantibacillus circumpalustris TaxID=3036359 RepID=UPI00295ACB3D|nr:hypothetical protein [Aurantibacillus circumpalustris]
MDSKLVRIEIFGGAPIGEKEAKEMNNAVGVLSKGKEILVLMLADEIAQFSKEAMAFSAGDEGLMYTIADAMVVKSTAQRITANFYLKISKPKKPSKIFNSEKDAIKWLRAVESNLIPA